mmetsp:Transcript_34914/g.110286  ORF Transcript_34914/g.110286 Transcript_34914/m.110286 type:complete len:318 (-) Transcript_34914:339-1292(-)
MTLTPQGAAQAPGPAELAHTTGLAQRRRAFILGHIAQHGFLTRAEAAIGMQAREAAASGKPAARPDRKTIERLAGRLESEGALKRVVISAPGVGATGSVKSHEAFVATSVEVDAAFCAKIVAAVRAREKEARSTQSNFLQRSGQTAAGAVTIDGREIPVMDSIPVVTALAMVGAGGKASTSAPQADEDEAAAAARGGASPGCSTRGTLRALRSTRRACSRPSRGPCKTAASRSSSVPPRPTSHPRPRPRRACLLAPAPPPQRPQVPRRRALLRARTLPRCGWSISRAVSGAARGRGPAARGAGTLAPAGALGICLAF